MVPSDSGIPRGVAAVLSFLVPGLGQLACGRFGRAAWLMVMTPVAWLLALGATGLLWADAGHYLVALLAMLLLWLVPLAWHTMAAREAYAIAGGEGSAGDWWRQLAARMLGGGSQPAPPLPPDYPEAHPAASSRARRDQWTAVEGKPTPSPPPPPRRG